MARTLFSGATEAMRCDHGLSGPVFGLHLREETGAQRIQADRAQVGVEVAKLGVEGADVDPELPGAACQRGKRIAPGGIGFTGDIEPAEHRREDESGKVRRRQRRDRRQRRGGGV